MSQPPTVLTHAFMALKSGADRLLSHRHLAPRQAEFNRLWKAIYLARYGYARPFSLHSDRPVALDSADHQWPRGSILNSSVNRQFNLKLYDYFRRRADLCVLDIGCAGGGFVRSILDDGYDAVGIEGSDVSQRLRSGEWDTIPYHLFTADATSPFSFRRSDGQSVLFDCITAWEVLEHIPEAKLPAFIANVTTNLAPGGIFVASIALFPDGDPLTGAVYHVTLQSPDWWLDQFARFGLWPVATPPFETADFVRGHGRGLQDWDPAEGDGFHVVLQRTAADEG
jgi:SAM-dependent methyltransferase